eukprot:10657005-Alexandrium_andersonii.AAC.1
MVGRLGQASSGNSPGGPAAGIFGSKKRGWNAARYQHNLCCWLLLSSLQLAVGLLALPDPPGASEGPAPPA